jgi:hypothetical protein
MGLVDMVGSSLKFFCDATVVVAAARMLGDIGLIVGDRRAMPCATLHSRRMPWPVAGGSKNSSIKGCRFQR